MTGSDCQTASLADINVTNRGTTPPDNTAPSLADINVTSQQMSEWRKLNKDTAAGDLGKRNGENSPDADKKTPETNQAESPSGENSPTDRKRHVPA